MRQRRQPALIVHRDHHAAWRNAIRATVATMLVASFWLTTHWSEAAGTLILVAVVSSLFASRPDPAQVSWGFFKGTLLALPVAFVVGQLALPVLPGFGWFVLFVVPILVPAALAMANPRLVGVATAFAINFLAFLNPHQGMSYDPAACAAFMAGEPVDLSRREQALLQALLQNPGRVLSAEQLKDAVYGLGDDVESNALNVHIHHLRRKLGNGIVETVRGIGYRLGPAGHASAPTEAPDP